MKFKKKNKSFTKKRKADYVVGEWTKASHKRLIKDKVEEKEFKNGIR